MTQGKFEESDRIQRSLEENRKMAQELHEDNKRLQQEYTDALEKELGSILPVLQELEWKLDIFFDMGFLLGDKEGDLNLVSVVRNEDNERRILKMFAPSSRHRVVCEDVEVENNNGVLRLNVDLGSLVKNVEWCLNNGINVVSGLNDEKVRDIFECQDKINAMYRLLEHEEGQK